MAVPNSFSISNPRKLVMDIYSFCNAQRLVAMPCATGTKADNPRIANIAVRRNLDAGVRKLGCIVKIPQPVAERVASGNGNYLSEDFGKLCRE